MAGPSASKNSTMMRIRKRLLRKSATPERMAPMAPVMALGLSAFCRSALEIPQVLGQALDVGQLIVQLPV